MSELDDILSKIYVEVPELPNKVIGLSRNMIAELKVTLLKLIYEARLDELEHYGMQSTESKKSRIRILKDESELVMSEPVEVITRYDRGKKITVYSVDGGQTYKTKEEFARRKAPPGIATDTKFDDLGVDGDYEGIDT